MSYSPVAQQADNTALQELTKRLDAKRSEIADVESKLIKLKRELAELEGEYRRLNGDPSMVQNAQAAIDNLKSRFNTFTANAKLGENFNRLKNKAAAQVKQVTTSNTKDENVGFLEGLKKKFNDFNVDEDEFDRSDVARQSFLDKTFYLKDGYQIDEEEIENDAEQHADPVAPALPARPLPPVESAGSSSKSPGTK